MRRITTIILVFLLAGTYGFLYAQSEAKEKEKTEKKAPQAMTLDSTEKQISYAMGYDFGSALTEKYAGYEIESLIQGLRDALSGGKPLMDEKQRMNAIFMLAEEMKKFKEQKQKEKAEQNKKEEAEFLAENAKKPGVITTDSGLQYKVLKEGTGATPKLADTIVVHSKGTLLDGTEFEDTNTTGRPKTLAMSNAMKGWAEGLQLMKEGAKYQFFVPSKLAYGENGFSPFITPHSCVIYEIELIRVESPKK